MIRESTEAYAELLSHSELWFQQLHYLKMFCDVRRVEVPVELLTDPTATLALEEERQWRMRLFEETERSMLQEHGMAGAAASPRSLPGSPPLVRARGGGAGSGIEPRKGSANNIHQHVSLSPIRRAVSAEKPRRASHVGGAQPQRQASATHAGGGPHTAPPKTTLSPPTEEDLPTPLQDLATRPMSPEEDEYPETRPASSTATHRGGLRRDTGGAPAPHPPRVVLDDASIDCEATGELGGSSPPKELSDTLNGEGKFEGSRLTPHVLADVPASPEYAARRGRTGSSRTYHSDSDDDAI